MLFFLKQVLEADNGRLLYSLEMWVFYLSGFKEDGAESDRFPVPRPVMDGMTATQRLRELERKGKWSKPQVIVA